MRDAPPAGPEPADRPQPAVPVERWQAIIGEKLRERRLDSRPRRYEVVGVGGRRAVSWSELTDWLDESARLGCPRFGFCLLDETPAHVTILFTRQRPSAAD